MYGCLSVARQHQITFGNQSLKGHVLDEAEFYCLYDEDVQQDIHFPGRTLKYIFVSSTTVIIK